MATPARVSASRSILILSDPHFPAVHEPTWRCALKWAQTNRPDEIIVNGDIGDFPMVSKFTPKRGDDAFVVDHINSIIQYCNQLPEYTRTGKVRLLLGNHDIRVEKELCGINATKWQGVKGLSLPEILTAHGLDKSIEVIRDCVGVAPTKRGQFFIQHADDLFRGPFGGGLWPACNRATKSLESEVDSHVHKLQMVCRTSHGRTITIMVCPSLKADQDHDNENCQRGFAVLELNAPDYDTATPHPILVIDGVCSYGGRTFDGNTPLIKPRGKHVPTSQAVQVSE